MLALRHLLYFVANINIMEKISQEEEKYWKELESTSRRGKIAGGLLVAGIGTAFMLRAAGYDLPDYVFTWPMLLIGISAVLAIKHGFRRMGWMVLLLIGSAFLISQQYPLFNLSAFLWPAALILIGLFIAFKPRRKCHSHKTYWRNKYGHHHGNWEKRDWTINSSEKVLSVSNIFSGTKRAVISKEFEGGEITNVFGGAEINLLQADFTSDKIKLEINNVFGGTKLLIPANWVLRSEMTSVVGGVEDQRSLPLNVEGQLQKVLVLTGSNVFGGIEINSY